YQIGFQYNPEQLRRSFAQRTPPPDNSRTAANRTQGVLAVPGPPVETVALTIVLDAADQLEDQRRAEEVTQHGLHAPLAALELLLYPASAAIDRVSQQADRGRVQIAPADTPLVLLSFGTQRVAPVLIASYAVTEELFDPDLNPIHAKVELSLKVLTYMEFPSQSPGREAFIAHQKNMESLARGWVGA
ncbi:MAG: hypothetical protein QOF37_3017, partial [Thermoleophilaceae bacterium]|nr:hypothetical protein [Thermoleophilaceae bacterium]